MKFPENYTLKKIYVSNYKNLFECNLDIENFSILVGSNNSGKSNFIELFEILNDIFYGGENGRKKAAKKMSISSKPNEIKFEYEVPINKVMTKVVYKIKFISQKEKNEIDINIENESLNFKSITSTGKPKILFSRSKEKVRLREKNGRLQTRPINYKVSVFDIIKSLYPSIDELPPEYLYFLPLFEIVSAEIVSVHKMTSDYMHEINVLLEELFELQKNKDENFNIFKKRFLEILGLDDMSIMQFQLPAKNEEKMIYYCSVKEKTNNTFSIEYLSDGTKILFLVLYHLFINRPTLLCIEEPEIGLHPKALANLFKLFFNREVTSQAIITTHSPYLLNLVNPENVFLLETNNDGLYYSTKVSTIKELGKRLKSKYVNFGDLFVENFNTHIDTNLE